MALRNYVYDFEQVKEEKKTKENIKLVKNKNVKKVQQKKANRTSLIVTLFAIFTMLIVINYRYNIISEKNLTVQRLQISETEAQALLTNAEIEYNKMVNIVEVEAFAKQQLGMQEAEKSQMVYLSSDYGKQVVVNSTDNFFVKIVNNIKQKINEIF